MECDGFPTQNPEPAFGLARLAQVLLIGPERETERQLVALFAGWGAAAHVCREQADMTLRLSAQRYDLIFLAAEPGLQKALDWLGTIRASGRNAATHVVGMVPASRAEERRRLLESGADAILTMPTTVGEISRQCSRWLSRGDFDDSSPLNPGGRSRNPATAGDRKLK